MPSSSTCENPAAAGDFGDAGEPLDVGELVVGDAQPAEPLRLVPSAPERGVALPEPPGLAGCLPLGEGRRTSTANGSGSA